MDRPIRAAVVGTGFIGAVHIDALRRLGIEIAGVLGSSPERGRLCSTDLGIPHAYASLAELLADDRVDVVHITSPNSEHAAQAHAVIAAGKHIVCEKPLATSSEDARSLLAAAEAAGLVHCVNFNQRFYPQAQEMASRVRDGSVGAIRLLSGSYLQDWLLADTDWNWRLDAAIGGPLRAVGDIGSHWLDLASFVSDLRVESVLAELITVHPIRHAPVGPVATFASASGDTVPHQISTEDIALLLVRYAGGARGSLTLSQVSPGRKNRLWLEVDGSQDALAWCNETPDELWIGHRGRASELSQRDPSLLSPLAQQSTWHPGGHAEGFPDSFRALYHAVYADVATGHPSPGPTYPTFADGLTQALIGDAVLASATSGTWAPVNAS
ncbi:MAG: Gfo/Idh/MocA family oxidoreductase [Thermoleophilia bacterium]|nr:Gfo/Idh/MocA family oxidoreductase [Thermoleophilia bacterium]